VLALSSTAAEAVASGAIVRFDGDTDHDDAAASAMCMNLLATLAGALSGLALCPFAVAPRQLRAAQLGVTMSLLVEAPEVWRCTTACSTLRHVLFCVLNAPPRVVLCARLRRVLFCVLGTPPRVVLKRCPVNTLQSMESLGDISMPSLVGAPSVASHSGVAAAASTTSVKRGGTPSSSVGTLKPLSRASSRGDGVSV
jgi:hypothetical protein